MKCVEMLKCVVNELNFEIVLNLRKSRFSTRRKIASVLFNVSHGTELTTRTEIKLKPKFTFMNEA